VLAVWIGLNVAFVGMRLYVTSGRISRTKAISFDRYPSQNGLQRYSCRSECARKTNTSGSDPDTGGNEINHPGVVAGRRGHLLR
jgi:hypothetical protein